MAPKPRWLCVDPGEDTGLSVWEGHKLIIAGTVKLWDVADLVGKWLGLGPDSARYGDELEWVEEYLFGYAPERIVCEDFRIYPWEAKSLAWDQVRTARLIGALTWQSHAAEVDFILQPAAIKDGAIKAGAEEFFSHPLHENRHANDSIMHGWFYINAVLRGNDHLLSTMKGVQGVAAHHPV